MMIASPIRTSLPLAVVLATLVTPLAVQAAPEDAPAPVPEPSSQPATSAPASPAPSVAPAEPNSTSAAPAATEAPTAPVESAETPKVVVLGKAQVKDDETASSPPAPPSATATPTIVRAGKRSLAERLEDRAKPVEGLGPKWRFELSLGTGLLAPADTSAQYFDHERSGRFAVFAARARFGFGLGESRRVYLAPSVVYESAASGGELRYGPDEWSSTRFAMHEFSGGLRLGVVLVEGIDVHAEFRGGGQVGTASLGIHAPGAADEVRFSGGLFAAEGGFSLYIPRKWMPLQGASHFVAGIETSIGYGLRSSFDLTPALRPDDDEPRTDVHYPSFGELDLRGLGWHAGVFFRFM